MREVRETYRANIISAFCLIFYVLMVYKWFNGMFLYQMQPFFFYTRPDFFSWLVMLTGVHKWLLQNNAGCIFFDMLFYSAPLLFYITYKKLNAYTQLAAIYLLVINWLYVQCYVMYPTTSIEAHSAWLLFPIVFIPKNRITFSFLFDGLRYFFLFFFASAGVWKIFQGGFFNVHQMSNILMLQHKELLAITPNHWYASTINYLIQHYFISYSLYCAATLIELFFIVGFFTKKLDRLLLVGFLFFLVFDHFIMRIPYYEVSPLLLTVLLSKNLARKYS